MYNTIKKVIFLLFASLLFLINPILAQPQSENTQLSTITIEQCYNWARENYPMINQLDIVDKTTQYNLSNASNGNLPQITLNGQATYQSEVTEIPIEVPNTDIPTLDKDQYKLYGEVYQPLTNFGNVDIKKKILENSGKIEKQKIEIDLYQLKDRINQIYFGALLIDEKIAQYRIIQTDLDSTLNKINAAIASGTATIADRQLLQVERISIEQQIDENQANKLAFLRMLSTLTQKNITPNTTLSKPVLRNSATGINRPELKLFSLQDQSLDLQKQQINKSLIPNIGLFIQSGYGRPALNFLSNEFEFYYTGGLKLNWNLSNFYNHKNSKKILDLSKDNIQFNKETFLLNTSLTQTQQSAEIDKYNNLIKTDNEIIKIRESILNTAKVQLSNGLITTIDYVKFLNEVSQAKQTFLLHETQRLLSQYNLKTTTGY